MEFLDKEKFGKAMNAQFTKLEKKTPYDPKYILIALGAALVFVIFGFFSSYVTCLVGIVLPTYWSIKAIESPEDEDDKQWLTYWCVYAVFSFLDLFAGFILKIIPFYFVVKLIFLVWCFMPNTQGAVIIYNNFLVKFFKKYESSLERGVSKILHKGQQYTKEAKDAFDKNKGQILSAGIEAGQKIGDALKQE